MEIPKEKVSARYEPNLRMKRARESRGWAQADLAERIGAQTNLVTRWERGYAFPSPYYRQKICEVFGEPAENLGLIKEEKKEEREDAVSPQLLQQGEATDSVQAEREEKPEESAPSEVPRRMEASGPEERRRRAVPRRSLVVGLIVIAGTVAGGAAWWWRSQSVVPPGIVQGPVPVKSYHTPFAVNDVDWSPDGALLACADGDSFVRIRVAATGKFRYTYDNSKNNSKDSSKDDPKDNPTDYVNGIRWSPDQQLVAFACEDGTARVWNPTNGEVVQAYPDEQNVACLCVAWSPTGLLLASSGRNPAHTVQVWDLSGQTIATHQGHSAEVWIVAWSPDGQSIASCGNDGTIQVWEALTGKERLPFRYPGNNSAVNEVAWSPNGKLLASAGADANVRILDALTGGQLFLCSGHTASVQTVKWSPDGKMLASGSMDATVIIWDAMSGKAIFRYPYHTDEVYAVSWSPDGQLLASGSLDKTLQIYRAPANG